MNNIGAHKVEGQSADEDQQDVRIDIHDLDEILEICK